MRQGTSLRSSVCRTRRQDFLVPPGIFIKNKSEQTNEVSVRQDRVVLEPLGSPYNHALLHQHRPTSCWMYHRSLEKAGVEGCGASLLVFVSPDSEDTPTFSYSTAAYPYLYQWELLQSSPKQSQQRLTLRFWQSLAFQQTRSLPWREGSLLVQRWVSRLINLLTCAGN